MQGENDMKLSVDITKTLEDFRLKANFTADNCSLALLGESGSGKSMTLKCISGIETPDKGEIILNNRILYSSEKKINIPIKDRKVGYLFQNYSLFPNMTVEENIAFGLNKKLTKHEKQELVLKKIEDMKLSGLNKRYPFELSGGQQQRVALARALAVEPEILLLDEPFSALDEYLRGYMIKQLKEDLTGFKGISIFVTHNMEEAYELCNTIAVLSNGKVDALGLKENIFAKPPTLSVAKLTGCKNISPVEKISKNIVTALDWGIKIKCREEVYDHAKFIGIRAHYLEIAKGENENVFSCWPVFTSETLFRTKVYIKFNNKFKSEKNYHVVWDISKEQWELVKNEPVPWKIKINKEKLFLI